MKLLSRVLVASGKRVMKLGKAMQRQDKEWTEILRKWKEENKSRNYRYTYPDLGKNSLVLDLGGYEGQWASDIYSRYRCKMLVFEPNPSFCNQIKERFELNPDIEVYCFGLAPKDQQISLGIDKDSTSVYKCGNKSIIANLKGISEFIDQRKIDEVDLMKINIEGGEYELLEYLISSGLINKIKQIQVQFHHFMPNAKKRMYEIQSQLQKTHYTTYQFPFLWENWKIL
ncbi:FkbM family methyltransferase [Portibacter marinus]|uniref:FkbM family methyltransferase n=1 Tax=Portibacter marinus TaxID=2898660 RepID=UPI001F01F2EF|nr:FkbM family methyltransferase [Portibacter marinus]